MPNTIRIGVANPDLILTSGVYGAGAKIRLQVAHDVAGVAGSFADVSGAGSTPTIPIVADVRWYNGIDPNGVTTDWYHWRYENAGGTVTSAYTPAEQPVPAPWEWLDPDGDDVMAYMKGKVGVDEQYARDVSAAVNAALDVVLETDPANPWTDPAMIAEVTRAAFIVAGALWKRREAPDGLIPFTDLAGVAVRVARDPVDGVRAMLARWHPTGGVVIA